jgi:hypothetical protein
MSVTEHYLANNRAYESNGGKGPLPMPPSKHVAPRRLPRPRTQ